MLPLRNTKGGWRQPDAMRGVNDSRPCLRRWIAVMVGALLLVATTAGAQPPDEAPRLDESHVLRAYKLAEAWVQAGNTAGEVSPIWVRGAAGARVDLRWVGMPAGIHMGHGEANPVGDGANVVDLVELTREATAGAIKAMALKNAARNARAKTESSSIPLATLGKKMLVDLQIAHEVEEVRMPARGSFRDAYSLWAPGYHGLRMTRRDPGKPRKQAWVWPATCIAGNVGAKSQLVRLLDPLGYDPVDMDKFVKTLMKIGRPDGPKLERFKVIHMVRPSRSDPPTQLVRGGRVIPVDGINAATLESFAVMMTENLFRRQIDSGTFAGTYLPSEDIYRPALAPDFDVALAAYALGRRASMLGGVTEEDKQTLLAQRTSAQAVDFLVARLTAKDETVSPPAMALLCMTLTECPFLADRKMSRDHAARRILALQSKDGWFASSEAPKAAPAPMSLQALLMASLGSYYAKTRDEKVLKALELGREWLWLTAWPKATDGQRVNALLWAAMLEDRLAGADLKSTQSEKTRRQTAMKGISGSAQIIRSLQIRSTPKVGPADVVGGFEFMQQRVNDSPPHADWRSAEALTFLALVLRQKGAVPDDQKRQWLMDCTLGARFIGQLIMTDVNCFYVRSRDDAVGAVRAALWQNELRIGPTALGLLAITELQMTQDSPLNLPVPKAGDSVPKPDPEPAK